MKLTILQGNIFDRIKEIPDNSVDLALTSPPYWGLRNYGVDGQLGNESTMEQYLDNTIKWAQEIFRVLKPSGNFVLNLGDCFVGSGGGGTTDSGINPNHREAVPKGKNWNELKGKGTRDWKANSTPASVACREGGIYKTKQLLAVSHFTYCRIISETDFVQGRPHLGKAERAQPDTEPPEAIARIPLLVRKRRR